MKLNGKRTSKNVVDTRAGKEATRQKVEIGQTRQVFDPELSKKLTYVSNRMASADRLANKGPGAKAMKSPPGKVADKFMPFKKNKPKKGK